MIYIPPPPLGSSHEKLTLPERTYSYPPKPPAPSALPATSRRFKFIRNIPFGGKKKKNSAGLAQAADDNVLQDAKSWEAHWEQGEYPFVILEGNRAACAICLMDFEEPKRLGGISTPGPDPSPEVPVQAPAETPAPGDAPVAPEMPPTIVEEGRNDNLKLEDAGEGAQPLRLLACGHVFHVSTSTSSKWLLSPFLSENMLGPLANRCIGTVPSLPEGCRVSRGQETSEGTPTTLILDMGTLVFGTIQIARFTMLILSCMHSSAFVTIKT